MPKADWPHSGVKRVLDIVFAGLLLIGLFPFIALAAICSLLIMGRPILFVQERPGRGGRVFRLQKFRTLTGSEEQRETPEGKRPSNGYASFLRASGLDEVPELWNILKGDMSFVGPRPLLVRYLDRYSAEQARRHHVRPGLTGWAQVHGRNALDWNTRLELDVWYVDHATWKTDLEVLLRTGFQILRRTGTGEPGEFLGDGD